MKKAVLSAFLWLAVVMFVFLVNVNHIAEDYLIGDDFVFKYIRCNDLDIQEDRYMVTGGDAFLVYDLGEDNILYNGAVYLENEAQEDISFQIFYADSESGFSEENSYYIVGDKGTDRIFMQFPNENIRYVRIDICEKAGYSLSKFLRFTAAERNSGAYLKAFFSFYHVSALGLLFILILGIVQYWPVIVCFGRKHEYLRAFLILFLCGTLLYWNYINGSMYYIFRDIAADSINQTYPYLLNMAERIQNGEWRAGFNFSIGLGEAEDALTIGLDNWVALFGKDHVAYFMGISQWMKLILSGMFAYMFARLYGLLHKTGLLVALGYAFSAEIILRGAWKNYPNLALMLIIWLCAFEYAHVRNNIVYLPIATVFLFYSVDVYYCVFWGAALGVYIAFRKRTEGKPLKDLCRIEFIYGIFALLGMSDTVVRSIETALASDRFSDNVQAFGSNLFATEKESFSAFLRTVGMSINGITDYQGFINFLEDPAFYCGILIFLLVPVSLYNMRGVKRRTYLLGYILLGLYLFVEPVRIIANGFAGDTYKLHTSLVIAFLILTAMHGLFILFSDAKVKAKSRLVFNITAAAVVVGMALSMKCGYVVRLESWLISLGCILLYGLFMNLMFIDGISKKFAVNILCICMTAEVMAVSWECVNGMTAITKEQMDAGMFYNSDYQKAVDYLKDMDPEWYRVEKKTGSVFLCDPLAQGYNGTTAYIGGLGVSKEEIRIYERLGMPHTSYKCFFGSGGDVYVDSLLGVKYFLIESGKKPGAYGLSYLTTVGDVDIYENELALPLAYTYDQGISDEGFLERSVAERRKLLLERCVLEEQDMVLESTFESEEIERASVRKSDGKYLVQMPKGSVLVIRLKMTISGLGYIYYEDKDQETHLRYYNAEAGDEIEIFAEDLSAVWFTNDEEISDIDFFYKNADEYYEAFQSRVHVLQENAMQMDDFHRSYIHGQVTCKDNVILATSIPFDENWNILVDGEKAEIQRVNNGFLGTYLAPGKHTVEFSYKSNSWMFDHKFRCAGFFAAICILIYGIYKSRRNDRNGRAHSSD